MLTQYKVLVNLMKPLWVIFHMQIQKKKKVIFSFKKMNSIHWNYSFINSFMRSFIHCFMTIKQSNYL